MIPFQEFAETAPVILLDGATGTELSRRGVDLSGPSWTAAAIRLHPRMLFQVHRDYVDAGANIITANTFRTHRRNLESLGWQREADRVTREAVQIAREAADDHAYVAGSVAPIGDCYSPDQTPPVNHLLHEHRIHASHLASAQVDLLLVETQLTIPEAVAATRAATETGLPVVVSFYCQSDGSLLSGATLAEAVQSVAAFQPLGISINCVSARDVVELLPHLKSRPEILLTGAYANTGKVQPDGTWIETEATDPAKYAELADRWSRAGTRLIGGCCGTTPQHISLLRGIGYED